MASKRASAALALVIAVLGSSVLTAAVAAPSHGTASATVHAGKAHHKRLLVIGDSITSKYNDRPGSPRQGYWSILARRFGAGADTKAEGNSGFVKPGRLDCSGTTFDQRLRGAFRHRVRDADALVVAGGRNDFHTCANGKLVWVSDAEIAAAVDKFFDDLLAIRPPDRCTAVFTPWGPRGTRNRARVTSIIQRSATDHGYVFVGTAGVLTRYNTNDGIHPDRRGNERLATVLAQRTGLPSCLRHGG